MNTILGQLGIDGPLWFQDPGVGEAVARRCSALWGVGNTMVIFLAAVLDVPRHLYESAELDGAGPFQRLRWVTLPTISPVILFAVVLGVIQGLQYFTQAYVAASVAVGPGVAGRRRDVRRASAIRRTRRSSIPVLLYQHGFRDFQMGYASAMAMLLLVVSFAVTLVIVLNSRRWVHYARSAAMSAAAAPRRSSAGAPPARVRRRRFLLAVANHSAADRGGDRVPRAVRLHRADRADDERPGALVAALAASVPLAQLHRRLHDGAALALDAQHARVRGARDARPRCSRASPSRTRSRACAGAAATSCS